MKDSKLSGVKILNSALATDVLNYNGSSPSGFTNSNYTGMTTDCSAFVNATSTTKTPAKTTTTSTTP